MYKRQEQTDLLQALFGRNGESPMPVIAAASPTHCFDVKYLRLSIEDGDKAESESIVNQSILIDNYMKSFLISVPAGLILTQSLTLMPLLSMQVSS